MGAHGDAREDRAMRILGISGSLRGQSHNTRLLRGVAGMLPQGAELVVFDQLGAIPPFNEDEEHAPPPAVQALKDAIAGADALLVSTPEYNHSIPGVLKNAVDWASRPFAENPLRGKPAAVIGASTSLFGAVWAQAELRKVLGAAGAQVLDRELPVAQAEEALGPDGLPREADARAALEATLDELIERGRSGLPDGRTESLDGGRAAA
ncbi:MAG TPA: NAD(P)H-dependent oxidoreductase [Solirubrobacteraceae bacterium]|nr:NAD(P)H-dependent oxidoreductase [Solirubrobacteraceae bacterium]